MPALGFSIAPGVKLSRTRQSQEEHGMYEFYFSLKRNEVGYFCVGFLHLPHVTECIMMVRGQYEWDCE